MTGDSYGAESLVGSWISKAKHGGVSCFIDRFLNAVDCVYRDAIAIAWAEVASSCRS